MKKVAETGVEVGVQGVRCSNLSQGLDAAAEAVGDEVVLHVLI